MLRRGAVPKPIPIGEPRPLTKADLERLKEPRFVASTPQKLRDSHHMIARLAAAGLRPFEIEARTSYSRQRITTLLGSPAMEELVARYREQVNEAFVDGVEDFAELATRNMLAAERHVADHIAELDEKNELLPIRTALAISRDAADRFGFGKHSTQTNVNVDFADRLQRAIKRSGKTIESVPASDEPRRLPSVDSSQTREAVTAQAPPKLRRRA